jgi:hypothetical protein
MRFEEVFWSEGMTGKDITEQSLHQQKMFNEKWGVEGHN